MRKGQSSKDALIATFSDEATRLMVPTPDWQRRMFRIAATTGRETEPAGPMAGRIRLDSSDKADR